MNARALALVPTVLLAGCGAATDDTPHAELAVMEFGDAEATITEADITLDMDKFDNSPVAVERVLAETMYAERGGAEACEAASDEIDINGARYSTCDFDWDGTTPQPVSVRAYESVEAAQEFHDFAVDPEGYAYRIDNFIIWGADKAHLDEAIATLETE